MSERSTSPTQRRVIAVKRSSDGDIIALCNPGESWSPRPKFWAMVDIETGAHAYVVDWPDKQTKIRIVPHIDGLYLRTDCDDTPRNNLLDLPEDVTVPHVESVSTRSLS